MNCFETAFHMLSKVSFFRWSSLELKSQAGLAVCMPRREGMTWPPRLGHPKLGHPKLGHHELGHPELGQI